MSKEDKSGGCYHVHRFHMVSKMGNVVCGMVSNIKLELTSNPDLVNCKLCLKKMAKANKTKPHAMVG